MDKELTPKQQTSEAIRQAETILIMTGQHPSVDQVAGVIALGSILRKFGKKVNTVISDDIPAGVKFLPTKFIDRQLGGLRDFIVRVDLSQAEVDKLKYTIENGKLNIHVSPFSGGFKTSDVDFIYGDYQYDLVIVLGVASYARIDRVYTQKASVLQQIPMVNLDFHRANEQYGAINLVEPNAAGLGEMLVALSESLQTGLIDSEIATVILTGIMAATDRFTATHTTSKAMTVAAQMMAMGANQQQVVKGLYREGKKTGGQQAARDPQRSQQERQTEKAQPRPVVQQSEVRPATPVPVQAPAPMAATVPAQTRVQPVQTFEAPDASPEPQVAFAADSLVNEAIIQPEQPERSFPEQSYEEQVNTPQPAPRTPQVQPSLQVEANRNPLESPDFPVDPELIQAPLDGANLSDWSSTPAPEVDTEGPEVTDPDDLPTAPVLAESNIFEDTSSPEPLINSEDELKSPQNQPASKPANPTNNPIFANRLS
jgi:nanoRNase/pAp phosphatase (c-di-AMP/oligoRNAs hydrolase)